MRYILLVVLLCSTADQLLAQVTRIDTVNYPNPTIPKRKQYNFNTDYWYTVAVRAYAYEQFPQLLDQPSGQSASLGSAFNGILFKINDNQVAYRLQAAHFNNEITFDNECDGCAEVTGKFQNTAIKVGAEKSVNYSRFQPYFGGDLGFMMQTLNTKGYDANVFAEDNKNALLFSPFIGAKFYVVSRVAIGIEANFNIAYTYQKINAYADNTFTGEPEQTKRHRWEYFFSPVAAVTLQYNFGLINQ
ncbi:hypothetical protein [Parapedobacter koreensis]|uniref:Outer membrane protein beta-barrel domain-containing protein n=1 Tax=Parapedobacter koreensis TaxID=332977 RepID=A0A1H7IYM0_9SPHI|nr:hypothetical protein [Parapedobacter koreensis]SEK67062.1 hypothetical protein SAMN05421740_102393 [Parapedobacter koreensis]